MLLGSISCAVESKFRSNKTACRPTGKIEHCFEKRGGYWGDQTGGKAVRIHPQASQGIPCFSNSANFAG